MGLFVGFLVVSTSTRTCGKKKFIFWLFCFVLFFRDRNFFDSQQGGIPAAGACQNNKAPGLRGQTVE